MYKLILSDGQELTGLRMNGNNFVSEEKVDESIFKDNLSTLTYTNGEETVTLHDAVLIQQVHYANGWYFCFRECTPQEKTLAALQTAITANADSMTDVQLALAEVYELILGGM